MRYMQESVAYDLERFAPRPQKTEEKIVKMPRRVRRTKAAQSSVSPTTSHRTAFRVSMLSKILLAGLLLTIVSLLLFTRMRIAELQSDITSANSQLEELKAEEIRLNMELEGKTSFQNIEQLAEDMGMQKVQPYQIHYISGESSNKAEIVQDEETDVLSALSDFVRRAVE